MKCLVTKLNAIISGGDIPVLGEVTLGVSCYTSNNSKYVNLGNVNDSNPITVTLKGVTVNEALTREKNQVDGAYNNAFTFISDNKVELNAVNGNRALYINESVDYFDINFSEERVNDIRLIDVSDLTLFGLITSTNNLYNVSIRNNKAIDIDTVNWQNVTPNVTSYNIASMLSYPATGRLTSLPANARNLSIYGVSNNIVCKLSDIAYFTNITAINIQTNDTTVDTTIENLVTSMRNAGRTSGSIQITLRADTIVSFNNTQIRYSTSAKTLSWTDTTITFDGVTINA